MIIGKKSFFLVIKNFARGIVTNQGRVDFIPANRVSWAQMNTTCTMQ